MAVRHNPRFKECRRLGVNVCGHPKAMLRAEKAAPGRRRKVSEYGLQLTEKQKVKAYYNILEKQMFRCYQEANRKKGITGETMLVLLECRLDNLVYRLGFANSIRLARQMVNHGHIRVDGNKVNIPSYRVMPGEVISLREKSRSVEAWKENFMDRGGFPLPYLTKDIDNFSGQMTRLPLRSEIPVLVDEQLVVELYSR